MEQADSLNFLTTLLPLAGVVFVIAVGVLFLNQHFRKNLMQQKLQAEELKNHYQLELLRSSIDAQELERKRISNDLHDELGATLSIARMYLIQLEEETTGCGAQFTPALQNIRSLTESSLASLRRISHALMPPQLEIFGITRTLHMLADRINSAQATLIRIVADELPPLNWRMELGIYRICLELITNTLKHAQATEITVEVIRGTATLTVHYRDNGRGLSGIQPGTGIGMQSIEARVSALSGMQQMHVEENGFHLQLTLPILNPEP
jgi:signal transduction histidine kinase